MYISLAKLLKVAYYEKAKATKTLLSLVLPCSTKVIIYYFIACTKVANVVTRIGMVIS